MKSCKNLKMDMNLYKKVKKILRKIYGYNDFRFKQYDIIEKIIKGNDVCAIMRTGAGKSLCFQIPAIYFDRPAIVISPLKSLMNDQKNNLDKLGISSCCYNSDISNKKEMRDEILLGKYKIIYITPESAILIQDFFLDLYKKVGISLIAVDEAHCISMYGFHFRKSYRKLNFFKKCLPKVPILAISATITSRVINDICNVLAIKKENIIKTSFNRPNLYLEAREKSTRIIDDILPIIKKYYGNFIIIYCLTIKRVNCIANNLKLYGFECNMYHAKMDKKDKDRSYHEFIKGETKIVVATNAFGMGIDKPDIRVVINYDLPGSIEEYYQEIGRAGRDGKNAYCYAFYNYQDYKIIYNYFINKCSNNVYREVQKCLLEKVNMYMTSKECRRKILLKYFDEELDDKCNFCDNCLNHLNCIKKDSLNSIDNTVDVTTEAKMLIGLINSIKDKDYSMKAYIRILRGLNRKDFNFKIKKNKYYGAGKHHTTEWWIELIEKLIEMGLLKKSYTCENSSVQTLIVTNKGIEWDFKTDLKNEWLINEIIGNSVSANPIRIKMLKEY